LSGSAFSQYYYNSFPTAGINPGGLNMDAEFPFGQGLPTGWTTIIGPSVATPAWSPNQTIPFTFNFDAGAVTQYKVSSTGVLTFTTAATAVPGATSAALPSASIPDKSVCLWGIQASGTNDYVVTKTFGTAPNRQHWVFFTSHALGGSGWSYWSIVMEETTDNIYIVDQRHSGTTGGVSMGIQINSTTAETVGANVLPIAGANSAASDNAYYEFVQGVRPADDIELLSLNFTTANPGVANPIQGMIKNAGSDTLLTYTMTWSADGGATSNSSIITQTILPGATALFNHPTQWTPVGGVYNFEVYTSLPNGNTDANMTNDSITVGIVATSGNSVTKNPLLEEFTTAPCQFCPDGAVVVEAVLVATPSVVAVGEHACFGTDAMTIPEASAYCAAFGNGAPTACVDRVLYAGETSVAFSRGGGAWGNRAASQATLGSAVDVTLTGTYNSVTRQVNVDMNANFVDYAVGDLRVTLFVVEDHVRGVGSGYNQVNAYNGVAGHPYFGAGSPITNYDHRHVLRDVYPTTDAWGDNTVIPSAPALNTLYTKNNTFNLNTLWNADSVYLVGLVSYFDANVGQRQVLNAVQVKLNNLITSIDQVKRDAASLSIYPNPTNSLTNLEINLEKSVPMSVVVFDLAGKKLLSKNYGVMAAGNQRVQFDVSNLSSGIYYVNLQIGNEVITRKISVIK
ncbi:MAG: Omp28-related outer membrane protein, partial [Flavobacteriales bacterium]|nr:Omp28-related outer membrane protein [Flavobacteriales bacterium]